ncbi:receptor-like protein 6 [Phragmites australis]|uniref:receptor-like protein 6 n=1 Tax=Phragmites australis TaxID=29695 RepID=UPI002D799E36|nr:receptor-like protein 6 [Phragmites australis]
MPSIASHRDPLVLYLLAALFLGTQPSCLLGVYSNQTAIPVPCLPDQASALLRLKRSFSTDGWGLYANGSRCTLASWRAGTDCCGWEGVRCGDANGRVTTLNLAKCGLQSASLHPALFELTSLRHLNLALNSFNGSQLPAVGFERLTELIHLNLSTTQFAGQIPDGIGRLTKLVSLDLSTKFFLGDQYDEFLSLESWSPQWVLVEPNIGSLVVNLSNLKELYLGKVDLSGSGAMWCSAFANSTHQLQVLSLPHTNLNGPICGSLSGIRQLTEINLQYNELYGRIPESFADLPSLSVLTLTNNYLEGWLPTRIFQNKNLTTIDIRYNFEVSGSLPNFSSNSILKNLLVSSTNFSGPIPSSIGNLKSLNKLGLAAADFSQELPSSIGELRSLISLQVSGAGIVGGIPSWIANLTSLVVLQFSDCGLSGEVPSFIGDLNNLTRLQLYNCNFSGTLPPQLFNLTQLEVLYLHSNNFLGTVELSSFWKLPYLFSLNLSNNKLTVVVDEEDNSTVINQMDALHLAACNISKFPSALRHTRYVKYLDLSCNDIHGAIPQWAWETWTYMEVLNLSHNRFSNIGQGYGSINLINIALIDLSFNLLQGPIPRPGPDTELLDCSNNRFSSIPLDFGSHFSGISYFMAYANNLSGKIPPSICEASNLVLVDLSYNNLSYFIPPCLMEDINSLSVLNLKRNRLHGELPNNMKNGCAFEELNFSDNWLEGPLPRSLVACRDLEVFDIGNNRINDTFPCWMSILPKLQVLVLKSNKFVGKVGPSVSGDENSCEFMKLRIFDLASNNFSGILQNEWFKTLKSMITKSANETLVMENQYNLLHETYRLTTGITYKGSDVTFSKILRSMVVIDVSDNAFYGAIPNSIGDLIQLSGINMSHNALTGPIPSQFGTLHQLESLDLSSNDLSGEIPQELASLDFLSILNLSYNKLDGRIPESPHFLTFSNLSFLGNIGLCGLQVSRTCNNITPNVELHHSEKKSVDIVLFLFAGLGFGVGFAVAIVLTWGIRVRRRSRDNIFMRWKKVFFCM